MASSMISDPPAAAFPAVAPRFELTTLDSVPANPLPPMAVPVSIALHVLAVGGLVIIPVLTATELPEPTAVVHAFFVEPAATIPPPPPPAPAVRSAARKPEVRPDTQAGLVAPIDIPTTVPERGLDLGVDGGMPGGVEGGVEGGVVGGVVGGLPAAPPITPVRVGGLVKEPTKIKDVAPEYPTLARRARIAGVVIIDAIIGPDGRVTEARILRGVPMLDDAALAAVRQWAYTPTLLGGVPVPLEMTVTVNFRLSR